MRSSVQKHLLAGALLCCAAQAHAQLRPAVVELFTSEGCSSCPPAEAYIGELAQRPNVLALAFHVDYWDDLGWRDRFGLPQSVQRQRTYAKTLGLASVYTPQVVLDGRADFVGSDVASVNKRLAENRSGVAVAVAVQDGEVVIGLGEQEGVRASEVILIAYQRSAISAIGRGENSGRTLKEFNIVRGIQTLGFWDGRSQQYRASVKSLPSDSTDVAVLVQPRGQGPIIGAATRALR
jgi:hypothetical protein